MATSKTIMRRLLEKVEGTPGHDECWNWTARRDKDGYGQIGHKYKTHRAHRISFLLFNGRLPIGVTDHLCENRACVNPSHLDECSREENLQRSKLGWGGAQRRIQACRKGHLFTKENTYLFNTKRGLRRCCKECNNIKNRARYEN